MNYELTYGPNVTCNNVIFYLTPSPSPKERGRSNLSGLTHLPQTIFSNSYSPSPWERGRGERCLGRSYLISYILYLLPHSFSNTFNPATRFPTMNDNPKRTRMLMFQHLKVVEGESRWKFIENRCISPLPTDRGN